MKIKEITNYLESLAPLSTQESYDNSGLLVGNADSEVDRLLVSLDCTESIVDEAIKIGAGLIVSHHPILFKGIKSLTGKNYVERVLLKAIKNDIALYAIHTNYDNAPEGVNHEIAERIGISDPQILRPLTGKLYKLVVFVPKKYKEKVAGALFEQGAGKIGDYDSCSFSSEGKGGFRALEKANPFSGKKGIISYEDEIRLEVVLEEFNLNRAVEAMKNAHPYEEVAYDVYPLKNLDVKRGAGMIGELKKAVDTKVFLKQVKENFGCEVIRHTNLCKKKVQKIAWCGGSGFFLLQDAIACGADLFITGDVKYHEFFDADNKIVLADIGHYESEQFTIQRLNKQLKKKFPNFAVNLAKEKTNPIKYL